MSEVNSTRTLSGTVNLNGEAGPSFQNQQSQLSGVPSMSDGLITSLFDRPANVGIFHTDQYNQAKMQDNANAYNYWLWQQQNAYNDPAAVMERYRNAGINPNLVAGNVSGTTASSPAPAQARYESANPVGKVFSMFSTLGRLFKDGVNTISELSSIPANIRQFRETMFNLAKNNLTSSEYRVFSEQMKAFTSAINLGVWNDADGNINNDFFSSVAFPDFSMFSTFDPAKSLTYRKSMQDLANAVVREILTRSQISNTAARTSGVNAQTEMTSGRNLDYEFDSFNRRNLLRKYNEAPEGSHQKKLLRGILISSNAFNRGLENAEKASRIINNFKGK